MESWSQQPVLQSGSFFSSSPSMPGNLVDFCCVFCKLVPLLCNMFPWPGISGADPALNQRVVDSYFRNWYYVRVKWATPTLVITKRKLLSA